MVLVTRRVIIIIRLSSATGGSVGVVVTHSESSIQGSQQAPASEMEQYRVSKFRLRVLPSLTTRHQYPHPTRLTLTLMI